LEDLHTSALIDLDGLYATEAIKYELEGVEERYAALRRAYFNHPLRHHLSIVTEKVPAGSSRKGVDDGWDVSEVKLNLTTFEAIPRTQLLDVLNALHLRENLTTWESSSPMAVRLSRPQHYPTFEALHEVLSARELYITNLPAEVRHVHLLPLLSSNVAVKCDSTEEWHQHPWYLGRSDLPPNPLTATESPVQAYDKLPSEERPEQQQHPSAPEPGLSTLMLHIDAMSRQAFLREFPLTTAWLRRFKRRRGMPYKVFEFVGMSTAGHSTPHNLMPMLTGHHHYGEEEFRKEFNIFRRMKLHHGKNVYLATTNGACQHLQRYVSGHKISDLSGNCSGFGGPSGFVDDDTFSPMCHVNYGPWTDNFVGPYSIRQRCIGRDYVHDHVLQHTLTAIRRHLAANRTRSSVG
jgi:hypothetical protein